MLRKSVQNFKIIICMCERSELKECEANTNMFGILSRMHKNSLHVFAVVLHRRYDNEELGASILLSAFVWIQRAMVTGFMWLPTVK